MTEATTVQMIPVEAISPSPLNPRSDLGERSWDYPDRKE
jgi:hypothetical protein